MSTKEIVFLKGVHFTEGCLPAVRSRVNDKSVIKTGWSKKTFVNILIKNAL